MPLTICTTAQLATLPDPQWLIDGYVLDGALAMVHAAPGVGKSFLALDWSLSIATAQPWCGRRVLPGRVLYVAGEGLGGLKGRVGAWMQAREVNAIYDAAYVLGALPLNSPPDIAHILAYAQRNGPFRLIVIDTLSRCVAGMDENKQEDMSAAVAVMDRLRFETKAAMLLVHHSTKNAETPSARGSTVIPAACDTIMTLVDKREAGLRLICEKQKDADHFRPLALRLREVPLTTGGTSCVLDLIP